jgi:hypothetical protein
MVVLFGKKYNLCEGKPLKCKLKCSVTMCKAKYISLTLNSGTGFVNKLTTIANSNVVQKSNIAKYM